MAKLDSDNKLWAAGPFADGTGALFIYEAQDLKAAQDILYSDPYFIGGVLAKSEVIPRTPALYNTIVRNTSI
jgi:uncharacterized protein YciI